MSGSHTTDILRIEGLGKRFGSLIAVDRVDLAIRAGEFTSVIGPNGAGKTTLFNLVTGALRPDTGRVMLRDQSITGLAPHRIVRAGLARTFQITSVFADLTAEESVLIACLARRRRSLVAWRPALSETEARRRAGQLLAEVGLADVARQRCGRLSHADQKLVEVAMALAVEPQVLLLDEPTAGMAPEETGSVMALLKDVARHEGATIVLIEHDMDVVFSVSERVVVLHQGRLIADGTPADIRANPMVKEVYLGGTFAPRH